MAAPADSAAFVTFDTTEDPALWQRLLLEADRAHGCVGSDKGFASFKRA